MGTNGTHLFTIYHGAEQNGFLIGIFKFDLGPGIAKWLKNVELSLAPGTVSNGYLSFLTSCKINQENISSNRDCNVEARMVL